MVHNVEAENSNISVLANLFSVFISSDIFESKFYFAKKEKKISMLVFFHGSRLRKKLRNSSEKFPLNIRPSRFFYPIEGIYSLPLK